MKNISSFRIQSYGVAIFIIFLVLIIKTVEEYKYDNVQNCLNL